jgi:hypothetical protein
VRNSNRVAILGIGGWDEDVNSKPSRFGQMLVPEVTPGDFIRMDIQARLQVLVRDGSHVVVRLEDGAAWQLTTFFVTRRRALEPGAARAGLAPGHTRFCGHSGDSP